MRFLFKYAILSALAIGFAGCGADPAAPDETESGPDSRQGSTRANWLIEFDAAIEESRETERPILINFTGSDWCPPCVQMKRDVFQTARFSEYARENLVLLELDFPHHQLLRPEIRRRNEELAERFAIQVFPTYLIVDQDGNEIDRITGYVEGGPEAFVAWIEN